MASKVGEAVIVIGADASKFDKDLKEQTGKAGKDAGERGGMALSVAMGNVLSAGAMKVGRSLGETVTLGFSTAMEAEVAQMKFTQLFKGQTDKAAGFIADLKEFAKRTPFEFPGLQDAASRFLAVGVEAGRVIPIMTNLGNITGIMGSGQEGINRVTLALQQMALKGKVSSEELLQMSEAGVPALKLLSEQMGVPTGELQKMIEKGLVPASAMFDAFGNNSLATMQTFSGGMDKMSQTTEGKLSTLRDTFSQFAGDMAAGLIPIANSVVSWLSDTAIPGVKGFIDNIKTWLSGVDWTPLQAFLAGASEKIQLVAQYVTNFVNDPSVQEFAKAIWDKAVTAGQALVTFIENVLIPAFSTLVGWGVNVVNFFRDNEVAMKALEITMGIVAALAAAHGAVIVASWIATAISATASAITIAAAWLLSIWPIALVIAAVIGLAAIIWTNMETIKNWISGAWDWITTTTYNVWNAIWTFFENLWNNITAFVGEKIEWLKGLLGAGWNAMRDTAVGVWNNIWSAFEGIWNNIKAGFEAFKSGLSTIWDAVKAVFKAPIEFVINTVINDGIIGAINWVWNKLGKGDLISGRVPLPPGWLAGGWTGPGAESDVSGYVHADEFVLRRRARRSVEGRLPGFLDAMNRYGAAALGYLTGGRVAPVGGPHAPWGSYRGHTGLDYPVPIGTPVSAFLDGIVDSVKSLATSYGTHVILGHAGGLQSIYAHLSRAFVSIGQLVNAGDIIGASGSSGNSTGPHLHFEMRQNGQPFDPTAMLGGAAAPSGFFQSLKEIVVNYLRDKAKALIDMIPGGGGVVRDMVVGSVKNLVDKTADFLIGEAEAKDLADAGTVGSGSGAQRWAGIASKALEVAGQSQSLLPLLLHRIQVESGGDPNAINNWDSNARAGHPSQGLMQTIPSTFAAYAGPFAGKGITDPFANIFAAIRYTADRYNGNFGRAWGGTAGYAYGTPSAIPGWAMVGERGPEWVRFHGGERVLPIGHSPGITVNMTVSVDDLDKMSKVGDFLDMIDRARLDGRRTARSGMVAA